MRTTDHYPTHTCGRSSHDGNAGDGSPTVIINGLKAFRIGDPIVGGCGGADISAAGSPNVMAGSGSFSMMMVVEPGVTLICGARVYDNTDNGQSAARRDEDSFDTGLSKSESVDSAPPQSPNQINHAYIDCNKFPKIITMSDMSTPVSKYFKLANSASSGMIKDQRGLTASQIACNWLALCQNILDPIYDQFKFSFNSGFRTVESGLGMTDHGIGCAADISLGSYAETVEMFKWIVKNQSTLGFSQCIFEKHNSAWVHISYNGSGPKGEARIMWTLTGGEPYSHGGITGSILTASNFSQILA
jgi:hypothetical protein